MTRLFICLTSLLVMSFAPPKLQASPTKNAYNLFEKARLSYRAKDFARAKELALEANKLSTQIEFETFAAWCVFRAGDQALGIRTLEALSARESNNQRAERDLGGHLIKMRSEASRVQVKVVLRSQTTTLRVNGQNSNLDETQILALAPGTHHFEFESEHGIENQELSVPPLETFEVYQSQPGQVRFLNAPEGLTVEVLGRVLNQRSLILVPGTYTLKFRLRDQAIHETKVVLPPAGRTRIDLGPYVESPSSQNLTQRTPANSSQRSHLVPIIITSAGLLSLGLGGFFHWKAESVWSDLRGVERSSSGIHQGLSQEQAFKDYSEGLPSLTMAQAFYGAGAALLIGGGALWLFNSNTTDPGIAILNRGNTLVVSGSF
jgi:hypothetical protein